MTAFRNVFRPARGSASITILSTLGVAMLYYYASFETSSFHYHAFDDYNDNLRWYVNQAQTLSPFAFSLGGPTSNMGGWQLRRDGKVVVPVDDSGNVLAFGMRHPIHDLVAEAERKWDNMVKRQSKTLHEAVREYKRRYGRMPPKGFDKWYNFAVENGVVLIDEFDQIDHDIAPYLAVSPEILRQRIRELEGLPTSFHIEILGGDLDLYGEKDEEPRALDYAALIQGFSHLLPDLTMHASAHDAGSQVFGEDFRSAVSQLLLNQQVLTMDNITHFEDKKRNPRKTLINACVEDSPAVLESTGALPRQPSVRHISFIGDHKQTMNFCENPSILDNHGALIYNQARGSKVSPYFVMCKLHQGGELLMPALAGYKDRKGDSILPWSERNTTRIFWRGRTTGNHFNKDHDWHRSHRIVLHELANARDGDVSVLVEDPTTQELKTKTYTRGELNDAFMDVGLVGPARQCSQQDGTCQAMDKGLNFLPMVAGTAGADHKYAIDVDGNGWSQRFQKLLASGSVVLKATIFPEWNTNWLIPYYHYIPIQHDYSDLYDTMVFFAGEPNGTGGHDGLAEQISKHAVNFVANHWRWEDIQAYMFRLLLEYARASSLNREKMTYKLSAREDRRSAAGKRRLVN